MTMGQWIAFCVLFIPTIPAVGWLFFRTWHDFVTSLGYVLTPDIISLLRGRLGRDWWAQLKFGWYVIVCLILAAIQQRLIEIIWESMI